MSNKRTAIEELMALAPPQLRTAITPPDWEALETSYGEPHRAYHNLEHVVEVARGFSYEEWSNPNEVFIAVLFHDVVYKPLRKDNEAASAERARSFLAARAPELDQEMVSDLIVLTARHSSLSPADVTREQALFLDCDMAILGAPLSRYRDYAAGVAREYAVVPRWIYSRKRRSFLSQLLTNDHIFLSEKFHHTLDAQARSNIDWEERAWREYHALPD